MFQAGLTLVTVKLILILLFLLFTGRASSHALNNTAWASGLKPKMDDDPPVPVPGNSDGQE